MKTLGKVETTDAKHSYSEQLQLQLSAFPRFGIPMILREKSKKIRELAVTDTTDLIQKVNCLFVEKLAGQSPRILQKRSSSTTHVFGIKTRQSRRYDENPGDTAVF